MKKQYKMLSLVLFGLFYSISHAEYNPSGKEYSERDKQKNIQRLRELAYQSQTETINSASNYNKAMFDAARSGYGGYSDINVEFDINDQGLSSAERASIENTRRNAAIMKEQLKGLK